MKLLYYRAFAWVYSLCGSCCDLTMVNSSWTLNHIKQLWGPSAHRVYPPCSAEHLLELPLSIPPSSLSSASFSTERYSRENVIVSVGQFRPEKDHSLQLKAFRICLDTIQSSDEYDMKSETLKLVMIGGCRHAEDKKRVEALEELAKNLGIKDQVEFCLNAPYPLMVEWLGRATAGIHTMKDEHFGITNVEFQAAGIVTVAHNSAGPKEDIFVPYEGRPTGYLATTAQEYADVLLRIFHPSFRDSADMDQLRQDARAHANSAFSDSVFDDNFGTLIRQMISCH